MFKPVAYLAPLLTLFCLTGLYAETPTSNISAQEKATNFKAFTGKVIGNHVRVRISPDLDSHIVMELPKDDYIVVTGEKVDFYAVESPADLKAFIFRGFVIDDVVEGDHVHVRLAPDREAPVIGFYNAGTKIDGKICQNNTKWLEISPPPNTRFYIAKEYIEYAGKPEMKLAYDKKKEDVKQLFDSTHLLTQTEIRKPFHEIDADRIVHHFQTIINDYSDCATYVEQATKSLAQFQEDYLHRKITYLEAKASKIEDSHIKREINEVSNKSEEFSSPTDRMKVWEPVEETLYLSWSSMHHAKTMDDFYQDQKLKAHSISGILEPYRDPVKHKPGDFTLKERDVPIAYVYSTHINLEEYVGKRVTLTVSPRENNNFAFLAFYVLDID